MASLEEYFKTLFDDEDYTCVSDSAFGNSLFPMAGADDVDEKLQYISINPMRGDSRADANVTTFRNFLVEFDGIPLEDQMHYIKKIGMPYSTATFSGNKSVHFIISLEDPLQSREEYDFCIRWIYNILGPTVDRQNKNPSRFSRIPGGTNAKTRNKQSLLKVRGRIENDVIESWLLNHPEAKPDSIMSRKETVKLSASAEPALLSNWTNYLLNFGVYSGKRNQTFYQMGFDFIKAGFSLEEAYSYIIQNAQDLGDFSTGEIFTCLKSAYRSSAKQLTEQEEDEGYKSWR